jgi:hypothetical protein
MSQKSTSWDSLIALEVRGPGSNVLYSQAVTGRGQEPMNQMMTGRNARISLEGALADAIRELVNDPVLFETLIKQGQPVT